MEIALAVVGFIIAVVYLGLLLNVKKDFKTLKEEFEDLKQKQKRQFYYNKNKKNNI
jgi:hypothetical protein